MRAPFLAVTLVAFCSGTAAAPIAANLRIASTEDRCLSGSIAFDRLVDANPQPAPAFAGMEDFLGRISSEGTCEHVLVPPVGPPGRPGFVVLPGDDAQGFGEDDALASLDPAVLATGSTGAGLSGLLLWQRRLAVRKRRRRRKVRIERRQMASLI